MEILGQVQYSVQDMAAINSQQCEILFSCTCPSQYALSVLWHIAVLAVFFMVEFCPSLRDNYVVCIIVLLSWHYCQSAAELQGIS